MLENTARLRAADAAQASIKDTASNLTANDGERLDFFKVQDGERFAGTHLIIDLWQAERLDELDFIGETLTACVEAAGATLLNIDLHHFTPNGGVSGVAVLAESHISIHTWPECGYAALDVFMCGDAEPEASVPVLREAFRPEKLAVQELRRGRELISNKEQGR